MIIEDSLKTSHLNLTGVIQLGFTRECYDDFEIVFLSYRFVEGRLVRISITTNPYLIMAKQQEGEKFYFKAVKRIDAELCANEAIIFFNTKQHLFGVYTTRQALRRLHKYNPKLTTNDLSSILEQYNKWDNTREHIIQYNGLKYVSKRIIDLELDYYSLESFRNGKR